MRRETVVQILLMGFMLVGVVLALGWVALTVKQLQSKQGRKEIRDGVMRVANDVVEDRSFWLKEFRVEVAIFGILAFAFLAVLLD